MHSPLWLAQVSGGQTQPFTHTAGQTVSSGIHFLGPQGLAQVLNI